MVFISATLVYMLLNTLGDRLISISQLAAQLTGAAPGHNVRVLTCHGGRHLGLQDGISSRIDRSGIYVLVGEGTNENGIQIT
jgi:hypothetical protein